MTSFATFLVFRRKPLVMIFISIIFICALPFPMPASATETGLNDLITRTQASFDRIKTLVADFTQETVNKGFGRVTKSNGRLYLLKPSRMRWEYETPKGLLLMVDGEKLWYYDPEENIAYFDKLEGYLPPKSPAMFLAGEEPLANLFTIELAPESKEDKLDTRAMKLTPKEPQPGVRAMLLKVDAKTYVIRELLMVDHLGNRNRLTFDNIRLSEKVAPGIFEFKVPEGARVQAMPRPGQNNMGR